MSTATENRVNGQSAPSAKSVKPAEYKASKSATSVILYNVSGEKEETLTVPTAVSTDSALLAYLKANPSVLVKSRSPATRGESGRSEYKPSNSYTGATMRSKLVGEYGFTE